MAYLEIMKGGAEHAEALTTCLWFSASQPTSEAPAALALSHLISICKPVNVVSPWRTFMGTGDRAQIFVFLFFFLLFYFLLHHSEVQGRDCSQGRAATKIQTASD